MKSNSLLALIILSLMDMIIFFGKDVHAVAVCPIDTSVWNTYLSNYQPRTCQDIESVCSQDPRHVTL